MSMEYRFDRYNCDDANEGGAEKVYILNIATRGILRAQIESSDDDLVDPDLHLLQGDDAYACLERGHREMTKELVPGRYVIIVDTWVNNEGIALAGEYSLSLQWASLE